MTGDYKKRLMGILNDPVRLFGLAMILLVLICYNILILHNGYRLLNSDDSSELVLARILASQHAILTRDWIYSSELRVFNTNLVFAPMFYLFSSWKLVRASAGTIMMLLYIVSYILIPYAWEYDARWFYATAFILIMPYANPWYFFGLKMYYLPHVFISFMSFAIMGRIYHADSDVKAVIWSVLLAAFGFVAGLGGARSVEYTYVPLLLVTLLMLVFEKNHKQTVYASFFASAASVAGYMVNDKLLSGIYSFHSYGNVSFIRFTFEKLEWALDCILIAFGYRAGEHVISFGGLCNVLAIIISLGFLASFVVLFRKRRDMSEVQKFIYYFATVTFLLNSFLMIVGQNDEYADRYIAIGMVPAIMLIDLILKVHIAGREGGRIVRIAVLICFLLIGAKGYLDLMDISENGERMGYISFVMDQGYDYGYATFWNANITTEMTDGKIDMTSLDPNADDLRIFRWLTDRRLIEEEHERSFLVLTDDELDMYPDHEPVYQDTYFSVFDIDRSDISFEE